MQSCKSKRRIFHTIVEFQNGQSMPHFIRFKNSGLSLQRNEELISFCLNITRVFMFHLIFLLLSFSLSPSHARTQTFSPSLSLFLHIYAVLINLFILKNIYNAAMISSMLDNLQ